MTDAEGNAPEIEDDEDELPTPPSRGDRDVWVGLFVIIGTIAVVASRFMLTDAALFRGRYIISTSVGNAAGIRKGDPVQMRGVNVGRVMSFKIVPEGVQIRLEIEGEYEIPVDSHVELHPSGLLGGMVADIVPGEAAKMLGNGDRIAGRTEPGMMDTATRISAQVETVLARMDKLLSPETIRNVESSSVELNVLLKRLSAIAAEQRRELSLLTANLKTTSESFNRVAGNVERITGRPEIERTIERLDSVTARLDTLTETLDRSARSIETVSGKMERGEGTLGKLAHDPALYNNLNAAAVELKTLTEDIRRQPKRYLDVSIF